MKVSDAISGGIFLLIAIIAFIQAGSFTPLPGVKYGPDLFPRLICVMMGLAGLVLVVRALRPAGRQPMVDLADWVRKPRSHFIIAAVLGSILFYILVSERLGFLLTGTLMLGSLLLATRGASKLISSAVIAVIVTSVIYLIFARALRVPLPMGVVEFMLVR